MMKNIALTHMAGTSGLFFFSGLKWYKMTQPTFSESGLCQASCQPFSQRLK